MSKTIHSLPLRDSLPTDELEVQTTEGGPSARVTASSLVSNGFYTIIDI